jgi:hypothetical protein
LKQNITIALEQQLLRKARILAAERGTSASRLLADELGRHVGDAEDYDRSRREALADLDRGLSLGGRPAARHALHARAFVDTNILIFAYDRDAGDRHQVALDLVRRLWTEGTGALRVPRFSRSFTSMQPRRSQSRFHFKKRGPWSAAISSGMSKRMLPKPSSALPKSRNAIGCHSGTP